MNDLRRVNLDAFRAMVEGLSEDQLRRQNEADEARSAAEHARFVEAYDRGECYLCGKQFKTISKQDPCVHWLLRQCKFKKKDFPLVYSRFGYIQIAAFVRWVSNQERYQGNINDLQSEKSERKVFEFTVKWKNIEWTFDCSKNDFEGHKSAHSQFPHYHMQMRIDQRPFIDFGDFHIPLSEEDLFSLDLAQGLPEHFHHSFGEGGAGMQSAIEIDPEHIVEHSTVTDDLDEATYRLQTMILMKDNPMSGEQLQAMVEESRRTGKTLAHLVRKNLQNPDAIKTVVSIADSVPEIARRTEREPR